MSRSKDRKLNRRAYFYIVVAGFSVLILILLFVNEARSDTPDIPTLVVNLVISTLCSIVVSVIYGCLERGFLDSDSKHITDQLQKIEKSLQRQNELYDGGILSIHPKTHFDNEESYWNNIINGTNKRLDLIGHSISNWFKREYKSIFIAKLKQIIESENDVNIILSAANVELVNVKKVFLEEKNENILSKVEKTILYLCRVLKEIPECKHQYLNVYITNLKKVTYLYIRTDEQCIISPYIYSKDSNNNSFLLELQPGTSYVKSLEDDFEEMISGLEQVDLSLKNYTYDKNKLLLLDRKETKNKYSGSDWDFEKTEKYIYGDRARKYEAGYFEHYKDKKYVKSVIELPISYGCPSKCLFCASSNIDNFEMLRAEQMSCMFDEIYTAKELNKSKRVLLSMTGMGDLYFNEENVFKFLLSLTEYENLAITLSSSYWDTKLLKRAWELKEKLTIRYIQLTYISDIEDSLMKIVPLRERRKKLPEISDFIDFVAQREEKFFRINYLVISNVNDSEEDIKRFIEKYKKIKEKIVVRISKLNETNASRRNALQTVQIERLDFIKFLLKEAGYKCYVFYSYENDNMNCGQLLTELP